jgi:hypothetical protein
MIPAQSIISTMNRIERVVMLTLIQLLLKLMRTVLSMQWIVVVFGSMNLFSLTLLHTLPADDGVCMRLLTCVRRVSLFIFTHAVMKASLEDMDGSGHADDLTRRMISLVKGFAVLCSLLLVPKSVTDEEDGERFTTQIVYAYASTTQGLLDPLLVSRVFGIVTFAAIIFSSYLSSTLMNYDHGARVLSTICQIANLVFYNAFTDHVFIDSGNSFHDLAIVLGIFSILYNLQNSSSDMGAIAQFATWRTATSVSNILDDVHLNGITMAITVLVCMTLKATPYQSTGKHVLFPWLNDLLFLVALNGIIQDVQQYLAIIGEKHGIPVLLACIITIAAVNTSVLKYTSSCAELNQDSSK